MFSTLVLQLKQLNHGSSKLMAILSKLCQEVMSNSGTSLLLTEISFLERWKCIRLMTEEKKHGMTAMCINLIYAETGMKLSN